MADTPTIPELAAWCRHKAGLHREVNSRNHLLALAAILEGMQWRPIEEAERDGRQYLLGMFTPGGDAQTVGWWADDLGANGAWTDGTSDGWDVDNLVELEPTHFAALLPPPPPETDR